MVLLAEGQMIRDTYKVERLLGRGAFAEVYRVEHRYLGRQAMKVFRQIGMSTEQVHDALGEAMLLSGMGHPNIIRVFEANTVETTTGYTHTSPWNMRPAVPCIISGRRTATRSCPSRPL